MLWLTGTSVKPWQWSCEFHAEKTPKVICYKYSTCDPAKDVVIFEREPSRYIDIQDPSHYDGSLGKQGSGMWRNVNKVFIVNGNIEKADANFVGKMTFDKIGETGIFLGQYPQTEQDVMALADAKIDYIFNTQSDRDIEHRGVDWPRMLKLYADAGMEAQRFPITDFNEEDLCRNLLKAAKTLHDLIDNRKRTVYVHCTAGMGRAPACVLVYLCLFKKVPCWQNPAEVDKLVKSYLYYVGGVISG